MGTIIRAIIAILVIIIAFKLLKGIFGLLIVVAIVGVLFFGAQKLLGGGDKRLK